MPIISVTLPNDGDSAVAANVDDPINAILAVVNGALDDANIASMNGSKILPGTLPNTAFNAANNQGWVALSAAPNTVTASGNRAYSLVFNGIDLTGIVSSGMRLKFTRTVTAPTQCTSLNGTTQYYSKTSPAGMTFTDTFSASAWIKITSYQADTIISRYNGTSGWSFEINASGQLVLVGFNGGVGNNRAITSNQSLPLNKWVHVFGSFQMSDHTSATCKLMFDGVDVPGTISTAGTNPTALIQAGNLEVGGRNGGLNPMAGKIAQAAVFSVVVSEATALTYMSQTLVGTETNLISAYSFNNSINDLNANANNLTANGAAVATNADTPFTDSVANMSIAAGTTNYGEVTGISFSTNTTVTVKATETGVIPTTGGLSAAYYSTEDYPYGRPAGDSNRTDQLYNSCKFNVHLAADQTGVVDAVLTKVLFDTRKFDTGNNFDAATNHRFTVPVSGFYQINAYIDFLSPGNTGVASYVNLFKNGVNIQAGGNIYPNVGVGNQVNAFGTVSTLIQLIAGDYLEIYVYFDVGSSTVTVMGGVTQSTFSGYLVSLL